MDSHKKNPVVTVKKKDGSYIHVPLDKFKPENKTSSSSADFSSLLQESLPQGQSNGAPLISENRASQVNAIMKQITFPVPSQFENRLRSIIQLYLKNIKGKEETEEVLRRKAEEGGLGLTAVQAADVIRYCDETMLPDVYHEPGLPQILPSAKFSSVKTTPVIKKSPDMNLDKSAMPKAPVKRVIEDILKEEVNTEPFKITTKQASRPIMSDIVPKSVEMGPVEELAEITLLDFRRLSHQPKEAAARLGQKISNLKDESVLFYLNGLEAWRRSPLYLDYINSLLLAIAQKKPLSIILNDKQKIQIPEIEALVSMEKNIV